MIVEQTLFLEFYNKRRSHDTIHATGEARATASSEIQRRNRGELLPGVGRAGAVFLFEAANVLQNKLARAQYLDR